MNQRILVADDEPLYLRTTCELLSKAGFQCVGVSDAHQALQRLRDERFDLVLSDLNMPGNLKYELLREHTQLRRQVPIVVVTGVPSLPSAIESIRLGIADYLLKPVAFEDLLQTVKRVLQQTQQRQAAREQARAAGQTSASGEPISASGTASNANTLTAPPALLGDCRSICELRDLVKRVAVTDASVLITGESGTGKEVVAQLLHANSSRSLGPFCKIDLSAIPEGQFESMLFGYTQAAHPGAVGDQAGLLQQADGGTAFLDELADLPLALQVKLLRVAQDQTFIPVGADEPVRVDIRFISTSNRDLSAEVLGGRFRQDLFFRLGVIHIDLLPLRQRGDDVTLLATAFLETLTPAHRQPIHFSEAALSALRQYHWPGNVRELHNVVQRAVALCRGSIIQQDDLPKELTTVTRRSSLTDFGHSSDRPSQELPTAALTPPDSRFTRSSSDDHDAAADDSATANRSREEALKQAENEYLISLLSSHLGNVSGAARQAGLSRQGLHKLLKQHGINASQFRHPNRPQM